jgi:3',5'-cyclic-AMP phosphodiesterase
MSNTPGEVVRILQITDFHIRARSGDTLLGVDTETSFQDTLAAALADGSPTDIALLTGDLVQDPVPAAYWRLRERLSALPCPAYCLPGNHDDPAFMANILTSDRVHCEPRILLDHWQIICLDSTLPGSPVGHLASDQLDLLTRLLDEQPDRHALIALHHHPVPSGSAWMDTMQLDNSAEFFSRLEGCSPVRGIVFGHIHQALDLDYRGVKILGAPSTCFQFQPLRTEFALDAIPPGYRRIELHPDGQIRSAIRRSAILPAGLNMASGGY